MATTTTILQNQFEGLRRDVEHLVRLFGNFRSYVNNNFDRIYTILESLDARVCSIERTMVTKYDLKNFSSKDDLKNFATKDDLKNFATKDDLKNFATKDDLKNFATKDDLSAFVTKDDLQEAVATLTSLIVQYNRTK